MEPWDKEGSWLYTVMILSSILHTGLSQCSGTPTTLSASESPTAFTSPGYPTSYANNLDCQWLIDSGTAGQPIMLYSDDLDLDCSFGDSVNIYDGSDNTSTALVTGLCGSSLQTTEYKSTDRYVLVTFTSDSVSSGQGFEMTYLSAADTSATGCTAEYTYTASGSIQYLTSNSFPAKYASSSSCRWVIEAPGSLSTITFKLLWSDIETDTSCRYDYMTIYDGGYFCENQVMLTDCSARTAAGTTPTTYTTTTNRLLVMLISDGSFNRYGFILEYTANIVATTTIAATTAVSNNASNNLEVVTGATKTTTEKELDTTLMIVSALVGSASSLLIVALVWYIKQVLARKKKTKPGLMTVQTIVPLPPRATHFSTRTLARNNNTLSFV